MVDLDEYLFPKNSPITQRQKITGYEFESGYEMQGARVNASKVNLKELVKRVSGGTAVGDFSLTPALDITSEITYKVPQQANRTFGKAVVALYQGAGTAAANQIYPVRGGSVTLGRYDVVGGEADYADYNGISDQWRCMIIDTNGTSSQEITFAADWIFLDYVTNTMQ